MAALSDTQQMKLRPLIVITGTLHIEGGATTKVKSAPPEAQRNGNRNVTVVHDRTVTKDRRKGNTLVTHHSRQLKRMRLLWTPFGILVDPAQLQGFQAFMLKAAKAVAEFNKTSTTCQLVNAYIWEHLAGNRLAAIEGWIGRKVRERDEDVLAALPNLVVNQAA